MNATPSGVAKRLLATVAVVAVLALSGRGPPIDSSIRSHQASAPPAGVVLLAQGRCVNGRCFGR